MLTYVHSVNLNCRDLVRGEQVVVPDGVGGEHDGHSRRRTTYIDSGRVVAYDDLRDEIQAEAAGLDPSQWLDGEFVFDAWLSDSLLVGTIERVDGESEQ